MRKIAILLSLAIALTSFPASIYATQELTDVNEAADIETIETESENTITDNEETDAEVTASDSEVASETEALQELSDANIVHSGNYYGLDWSIDRDGLLTITDTVNYCDGFWDAPWKDFSSEVKAAKVNLSSAKSFYCMFTNMTELETVEFTCGDTSHFDSVYEAFSGCEKLKNIDLSFINTQAEFLSMTRAFYGCTSLEYVILPQGVEYIDSQDFSNCRSLRYVYLPESLNYKYGGIQKNAFASCFALTDVGYGCSLMDKRNINIYEGNDYLKNATPHYNVTSPVKFISDISMIRPSVGKSVPINLKDLKGNDIPKTDATYVSSNPQVASVDSNGVITANLIGVATITVTMDGSSETIYVYSGVDYTGVTVTGRSLMLNGEIGIVYYFTVDSRALDVTMNQYYVLMTSNKGGIYKKPLSFLKESKNSAGEYCVSYLIPIKDVADTEVTFNICDDAGNVIKLDNTDAQANVYSVARYRDDMERSSLYSEAVKAAVLYEVDALLDYSGYARAYFTGTRYSAQNDRVSSAMGNVTKDTFKDYERNVDFTNDDVSYTGSSLVLTGATSIRHYYDVRPNTYPWWRVDGRYVMGNESADGRKYIEITGIPAFELDRSYTLTADDGYAHSTVIFSPFSYAYAALSRNETDALADTMKAMYVYNQAVKSYYKTVSGNI